MSLLSTWVRFQHPRLLVFFHVSETKKSPDPGAIMGKFDLLYFSGEP
ncbi:UNVERIFIED_ORG: hypothetical protein M2414_004156 [Rahnella aquatilis]